jgi:hypothetical protein
VLRQGFEIQLFSERILGGSEQRNKLGRRITVFYAVGDYEPPHITGELSKNLL